jgi:hypothetical protein
MYGCPVSCVYSWNVCVCIIHICMSACVCYAYMPRARVYYANIYALHMCMYVCMSLMSALVPTNTHIHLFLLLSQHCTLNSTLSTLNSTLNTLNFSQDAGVDDAFALAMAIKLAPKYQYEVKLFSTVFGNCGLEQVVKNVAKCRSAATNSSGISLLQNRKPNMYIGHLIRLIHCMAHPISNTAAIALFWL